MEVVATHPDIKKRIAELPRAVEVRVLQLIELLQLREYRLSMPFSKKISKNLYELRVMGEQHIRIFYTFHSNRAVLLHIVSKKSQKLQKRDLETARQRLRWLR